MTDDLVPRSRLNAVLLELDDANAKIAKAYAGAELLIKEATMKEREACAALAEDTAAGRDADAIAEAIRAQK